MIGVPAYFGSGDVQLVSLGKDIKAITAENVVMDETKLQVKLDKEKARDPRTVGFIDFKVGVITLYDDGKFRGHLWQSRSQVTGKWERT